VAVQIRPLPEPGKGHWLLAGRRLDDREELAYSIGYGPAGTTLAELVGIAGARWTLECCFQQAKGEAGLDHDEVRRYDAWYRHITLAMLAQAFLVVMRAGLGPQGAGERAEVADPPAGLSVPEIRRLLGLLVWPATTDAVLVLGWSWWRRRHQARARRCHWRNRTQKMRL
jgi:hypothetical protein